MAAPLLDRVIGYFAPGLALARHFERRRLDVARAYEAASPRDPWRPRRLGASANADHLADAAIVRGKARALVQNVPYCSAALDAIVRDTIGTGITTEAKGNNAARLNALWSDWGKVCDADGVLDWPGMQAAAERAMEQDGEVLVRLRARRPEDGLPVPLQIQLLEIDWLDTLRNSGMGGRGGADIPTGHSIIEGKQYDALGRVVAYWLFPDHPGGTGLQMSRRTSVSQPVPASQIIHLYAPSRPGAGRGFSRFAPVISRVRDLQLLEDAELARKNLESRLAVVASGDVAGLANPNFADPEKAATTGDLGQLPSGGIVNIPPGMNLSTVAPNAAPGHDNNVKLHLHLIAAGLGVTYEDITGDLSEVNMGSARVGIMNKRRRVEQIQWQVIIPKLIDPVWRAFVDAAVLIGVQRRPDYRNEHSTPRWEYINPAQDAEAELSLISGGLLSWSESLRRRNYKPADVFAEFKSDIDTLRASGVLDVLLALQKGRVMIDQTPDSKPLEGGS